MESFNPFSNSISRTFSSVSESFINSIQRQPVQKTTSTPLPAIKPLQLILPSEPAPILASSQNSTPFKKKRNYSSRAKPGAPSLENQRSLRPLLASTFNPSKSAPVCDPFQNSILPSKPIPALKPPPNTTLPTPKSSLASVLPAIRPSPTFAL